MSHNYHVYTTTDVRNPDAEDEVYERLRLRRVQEYVDDMMDAINNDLDNEDPPEGMGEDYDWRDEARQEVVNTYPTTEQDFMDYIGNYLTGVQYVRFIMEMEKAVKNYNEENGFDYDTSVVGDIGKLYGMWVYVITDEVEFQIEYTGDDSDEGETDSEAD